MEKIQLDATAMELIQTHLGVEPHEITGLRTMKKGMTNHSYIFDCRGESYVIRIPGPGTDKMVDRKQEAEIYHMLEGSNVTEPLVYIDPVRGYKITKFLGNAKSCDVNDPEQVAACMRVLRRVHEMKLTAEVRRGMFDGVIYYENLKTIESPFPDYQELRTRIMALRPFVDSHREETILCHLDPNADNFLVYRDEDGVHARLIDWEFAGMYDPVADLAGFAGYDDYTKEQVDGMIEAYFGQGCTLIERARVYAYIAAAALWLLNWCEYKQSLGEAPNDYYRLQYAHAREYCDYAEEAIRKMEA